MHPPSAECRRLFDTDPTLRYAWAGDAQDETPEEEREENAGQFVVCRLLPRRKVALRNSWYCEWGDNEDAGPIFSKSGRAATDWPADMVPVIEVRIPREETSGVFSGSWLNRYRRLRAPKWVLQSQEYDKAREKGLKSEERIQTLVDEIAGDWRRVAGSHDQRTKLLTKEDAKATVTKQWERIEAKDKADSFENHYVKKHGLVKPKEAP